MVGNRTLLMRRLIAFSDEKHLFDADSNVLGHPSHRRATKVVNACRRPGVRKIRTGQEFG